MIFFYLPYPDVSKTLSIISTLNFSCLVLGAVGFTLLLLLLSAFTIRLQRKLRHTNIDNFIYKLTNEIKIGQIAQMDYENETVILEMRDTIENQLLTLNMFTSTILNSPSHERQNHFVEKIHELAQNSQNELRSLMIQLETEYKQLPRFTQSINKLAEALKANFGIEITVELMLSEVTNRHQVNELTAIIIEMVKRTLASFQVNSIKIDISEVNNEYISYIYEVETNYFSIFSVKPSIKKLQDIFNTSLGIGVLQSIDNQGANGFSIILELPYQ